MAKSKPDITPKDPVKYLLENPTITEIPDHRGPLVYERALESSLNGIDPNYMQKEGV